MKQKITAIIQARLSSTRLLGKVLLKILNKPMLQYVIDQVNSSKLITEIIIATTNNVEDKKIIDFCKKHHLKYFRGSKKDVLDRYYQCAKKFECDPIVRITSDCPLIDPEIIDKVIEKFLKNSYDYVANNLENKNGKWVNSTCNFPQGMTVEISSFEVLRKAWKQAKKPSEREHVYPYVQFNPNKFKAGFVMNKKNLSYIRCTVDHPEDLQFVKEVIKKIPKRKKFVTTKDIVNVLNKEDHLLKINNKIPYDEGYKISLLEDKKQGFRN